MKLAKLRAVIYIADLIDTDDQKKNTHRVYFKKNGEPIISHLLG